MATKKNKYAGKPAPRAQRPVTVGKSTNKNLNNPLPDIGNKPYLGWLALALILTLLALFPSFSAGWVNWDDEVNVLENMPVQNFDIYKIFTSHVIGNYNPLTIFTFALEWKFFQNNPFPYHFNNIVLHLACTALVFILSKRLGANNWVAFIITCLFGFQPMRVESVTWITERKDVLYGVFYLSALAIYAKNGLRSTGKTIAMLILMTLSCLSKIQAVSLPLSMLAIDYLRAGKWSLKDLISKWAFFAVALITGLIGIYFLAQKGSLSVMNDETNYNMIQRLVIGVFTFIIYLVKSVIPYRMSPLYPYPGEFPAYFYLAIIPFVALIGGVYYFRKKIPKEIIFGLLFFTVNVMFMLQVLGAGQGFLADRFTYIGYYGLFFAFGYIIFRWIERYPTNTGMIKGVAYASLAVFWFMTNSQTKIWHDSEALWTHVMKYYKNTSLPFWNRANAYRDLNRTEEALKDYSEAIRLEPKKIGLYNSRGKLFFTLKQFDKAEQDYIKGLQVDSTDSELWVNLAATKASQNDLQSALKYVNKGIKLKPDNAQAYKIRFILYLNTNQDDLALKDAEKLVELGLREADMYYERALIYKKKNLTQKAMEDLNTSIQIGGPNAPIYYHQRASMYEAAGNASAAQQDTKMANELEQAARNK